MPMNELPAGEEARIKDVEESPMRYRLMELGAMPGSTVRRVMKSPLGGNDCYLICGALIVLRDDIAATIDVEYGQVGEVVTPLLS